MGRWPRILAVEPGGLAQHKDEFARFPERNPKVLGRTRISGLAPQCRQRGPVERPRLCDRLFLDVAGKFIKPINQGLVDVALGRSIGVIFDQG